MPSMAVKKLLLVASLSSVALSQSAPEVNLDNGTYVGFSKEGTSQDSFFGIPYAQPPTGSRRFAAPQALTEAFDEPRSATEYGLPCIGYNADTLNLQKLGIDVSEDCLTLNVVRPSGTKPGDDLPVGVWVHGGSYVGGSGRDERYDFTNIVEQSVKEGKPMVAVSINYRLSYWGFMFSNELQSAGAGNMAFRDQRMAFQWVQDNIAAFGGSPEKVAAWGESAGARSLGMQLIAYDGKHDGIFRSAVMESGSMVTKFNDADTWQPYFDALVEKVGCSNDADRLECLRALPWEDLNDVFNSTSAIDVTPPPFTAVIDGDFMTAQAPVLLEQGKFAHVPVLIGNNFDEGTAYGKQGIDTEEEFVAWLESLSLSSEQIDNILALYPDDPAVGIPSSLTERPAVGSSLGAHWKRVAAFAGDFQQHAGRRLLAQTFSAADLPIYSYLWNVYVNGIGPEYGATHFQEVAFVFNDVTSSEFTGKPETFVELADLMSKSWVHFIADLDPNFADAAGTWPLYTPCDPYNLVFDVNVTDLAYIAEDNTREEEIAYLNANVYE